MPALITPSFMTTSVPRGVERHGPQPQLISLNHIPDLHNSLAAAGDETIPVRTEGYAGEPCVRFLNGENLLAGNGIPQLDLADVALAFPDPGDDTGDNPFPIGTESHSRTRAGGYSQRKASLP